METRFFSAPNSKRLWGESTLLHKLITGPLHGVYMEYRSLRLLTLPFHPFVCKINGFYAYESRRCFYGNGRPLVSLREYWLEYCNRASRKFFLIQCNLLFKKYLLENGLECFVLIESTPVGRCISPSAFPRTWKWFSVFFQLVRFLESTRSISSFNLSSARIALPERKGIVPFFLLKCHPHRSPSDPLRAYYVSSLVSHCRVYAHFSCPWLYR